MAATRTLDADTAAPQSGAARIPGEVGIWLLVLGDMFLEFGTIFGYYLYDRAADPALFAQSRLALNANIGLVNTLVLLTSSMFVALGVHVLRANDRASAARMSTWGRALGFVFVAIKAVEYGTKYAAGITVSTNTFFMYYFSATGLHLAHVLIGILMLTYMINGARQLEPRPHEIRSAEVGGVFWHMVDLIWIILFPLLYLVV